MGTRSGSETAGIVGAATTDSRNLPYDSAARTAPGTGILEPTENQ
jgi:hypothetical protein